MLGSHVEEMTIRFKLCVDRLTRLGYCYSVVIACAGSMGTRQ